MTLPESKDAYVTHLKVKYLSGLISTTTGSAGTSGNPAHGSVECDKVLEIIDSDGTSYGIPLYTIYA